MPTPTTEEIIGVVRISREASSIASLEKCFSLIDKEIVELNKESQRLQGQ